VSSDEPTVPATYSSFFLDCGITVNRFWTTTVDKSYSELLWASCRAPNDINYGLAFTENLCRETNGVAHVDVI